MDLWRPVISIGDGPCAARSAMLEIGRKIRGIFGIFCFHQFKNGIGVVRCFFTHILHLCLQSAACTWTPGWTVAIQVSAVAERTPAVIGAQASRFMPNEFLFSA